MNLIEEKKFNVIYADPPWSYENKNTGGDLKSGSQKKYNTMSLIQIKNIKVNELASKDAFLFIWIVVPLLPEALQVIEAWGFKYKTMISWRKIMSLGMGYWFRGQMEHLILATRGKVRAFRSQKINYYESRAEEHSKKPDYFRMLIEESTRKIPDRKMIELFARGDKVSKNLFGKNRFDGWYTWGNQIESDIELLNESH